MKKSLLFLLINAGIILAVNTLYVLNNVPSDGRWMFQIFITSSFFVLYLLILFFAKMIVKGSNGHLFISFFNIVLMLIFVMFAKKIEAFFQYNDSLYIQYISMAPYIIFFGAGIFAYIILELIFKILRNKNLLKKDSTI